MAGTSAPGSLAGGPAAALRLLSPGDPAPTFIAASNVNPRFNFASAAGRYIVLCFFGGTRHPIGGSLIETVQTHGEFFLNPDFYFFGVALDREDRNRPSLTTKAPGMDIFWDSDGAVARLYNLLAADLTAQAAASSAAFRPVTYVLDCNLRILAIVAEPDGKAQAMTVMSLLRQLPPLPPPRPFQPQAPVLVLPHLFEPALCRRLIDGYNASEPIESGYMVERDGKTVQVVDHRHKRRSDWTIIDETLRQAIRDRIMRRLVPEIHKAFNFQVTRMERYLVACYDAEAGGYFRPHRDNTTKGTAHRRFAVTVNLNAGDYEGGDLAFPEYGRVTYRAPTGGAVVFSCSLLHEARAVTKGRRYAFLPFLYDEAAARQREANNPYLEGEASYRAASDQTGGATPFADFVPPEDKQNR
ncbi:2OG-Fe(II) oxygenase [Dongia soli]|uniref:2OG-Fe(II) oxygenase n=1 Tax=Dongia soli TaxID=600628 RepID=A0ABU5EEF3_9PROT|nr:2OG-Fe(II) oxygenase [Dongia soli]MDY0884603.1 2OG-Fe(II) oxygenase [Dongia soli]